MIGALLAVAAGAAAWRRDALSSSGALGAAGVGSAIYGATGWRGSALLMLFFAGSTALSRLSGRDKTGTVAAPRRTLTQVLANGGVPAFLALSYARRGHTRRLLAYGGALAAANADTWATEIGRGSRVAPRMITTGRRAESSVSGAVTPRGTLASLAGAAVIGGVWALLLPGQRKGRVLPTAARLTSAGFVGALADSVLGATLQGVYTCGVCGARTEDRAHAHGGSSPALARVRGLPFMTNDAVNLCASLTGALVAVAPRPDKHRRRRHGARRGSIKAS